MERGSQFVRQWKLLAALSARRFGGTIEDLAKELECHARTIRRDLDVLRASGFPIDRERDRTTREVKFKVPASARMPTIPFTLTEVLALYFSANMLKSLKGTPLKDGIDAALRKVEKTLPEHVLRFVSTAENALLVKSGGVSYRQGQGESLCVLQKAVADERKVEIVYRPYGATAVHHHRYHPYGVAFSNGSIYLVGHSELRGALRTLALNRVEKVRLLDERFHRPNGYDVANYFDESFGVIHEGKLYDVEIEFSKEEAPGVREREFHPSQQIRELRDGRIVLSMKVAGIPQIARWVLSYGAGARVLGPPELVKEMAARLCKT